jgi:hypothetical protein
MESQKMKLLSFQDRREYIIGMMAASNTELYLTLEELNWMTAQIEEVMRKRKMEIKIVRCEKCGDIIEADGTKITRMGEDKHVCREKDYD